MADTLESLELEVKYSASGASSGIQEVANSIKHLGDALGKTLPQLKEYADVLKTIGKAKIPSVQQAKADTPQQIPLETQDKGAINSISSALDGGDVDRVTSGFARIKEVASSIGEAVRGAFSTMRDDVAKVGGALSSIGSSANRAKSGINSAKWSIKELSQEASKSKTPLSNFISSLKRIAYYRMIRGIIKSITQAFKEGLEKAYIFSSGMTDEGHRFAEAMNAIKAAGNQMKLQLGGAFIALLTAVAPILIALINLVTKAADAIAQLLSAFTGNKYLKANKTAAQFADNMKAGGAAAKEWKNQLLGFDEINRLNEPSNGGGGGGSNPLDGFDMQSADISEFWLKVAEKIKPILEDIKLAFQGLRDFVVGVFTGDWDLAFQGLGTIVEAFGSIVSHVLNGFVLPVFDGFSQAIINRVDGLLKKIEELTGLDLTNIRQGIIYGLNYIRFSLEGFAIQASWIIQDLCDAISAILRGDWDSAWESSKKIVDDATVDVSTVVSGMATTVTNSMVAGGNASADFAEAFSANMETARGQMAATGNSSLSVNESSNGISFVARIANFVGKILRFGGLHPYLFANGGFPDEGSLFFAGEQGAELVGTMGGRTAVANNQEITEGIRQAVYDAMTASNANGNNDVSVRVYLDSREIKAGQQRLNRAWGVG